MSSESLSFVAGGGDMGERIRAFDWSGRRLVRSPDGRRA